MHWDKLKYKICNDYEYFKMNLLLIMHFTMIYLQIIFTCCNRYYKVRLLLHYLNMFIVDLLFSI